MQSMTGYAKRSCTLGNKKISVEIKTLNSKQLDIITKLPASYRGKDLEIRALLGTLERGKIDFILSEEAANGSTAATINRELIAARYNAAIATYEKLYGFSFDMAGHLAAAILHQGDVWQESGSNELNDDEWTLVRQCVEEAVQECIAFRRHEGTILQQALTQHIDAIEQYTLQVPQYEQERIDTVRQRLSKELSELQITKVDSNRFEQEIIYYLEKLDITEEKVRLAKHIAYFRETMAAADNNGKKLGFIAQEMGREINTTGSKANHVEIQRLVVGMKDELEKIKEQLANIL